MKKRNTTTAQLLMIAATILIAYSSAIASSGGYTNRTNKNGITSGCGSCHGGSASSSVLVSISGPTSLTVNQVVAETLTISGGPASGGGCDISSSAGALTAISSHLYLAGSELTQSSNTAMSGGKVQYIFNYKAPATPQTDTIYAVGLSTNSNGSTSGDSWNWAPKKVITVSASNPTDTTPPSISLTNPSNGATVSNTISVSANASDNIGVVGVQFKLNGTNLGSEFILSPYSYSWNTTLTSNGTYTLSAVARDAAGNTATSSVTVTISNVGDTTHPNVSVTNPANGASVSGTVSVTATASDNVGVAGVQFQLNGANAGSEDVSSPYSYSWNTKLSGNGSYTLSAVARDAAGNKTTSSITVSVNNVVDTTAPGISLILPLTGDTLANSITVTATASDNIGVAGVQFQIDGVNRGSEVTSSPYTYSWNTALDANGTHTVSAIARDAAGNNSTSSATVTVLNVSPPNSSGFQVVAADNFNRADQASLSGAKWGQLINQTGSGTIKLVNQTIQAYNANGVGNAGGVVWDSLVSKGTGVTLTVTQKAGNNSYTSLFIYARMNTKDLTNGNGYRFRYVDNPAGNATLAIQRVRNGTTGTDLVTTTHAVNVGDTLKFIVENDAKSTMDAFVNSTQVLSVVDTTYVPSSWYFWVRGMILPTLPAFDNFTLLMKVPTPLPVQLSSFTANTSGSSSIDLNWATITETNNNGFYVERKSSSQQSYQPVSNLIPGAGTSANPHQYSFKDTGVTPGTYYYRLKQLYLDGSFVYSGEIVTTLNGVTGVNDGQNPMAFQLFQNYPNPFNPSTLIKYEIPQEGRVVIKIYNLLGNEIATLADEVQSPGIKELRWNATSMPSGVYLYRLTAGKFTEMKKMVLLK